MLTASTSAARALVFTDGACEGEEGNQQLTIDWTGRAWFTRWFSGFVSAELASAWQAASKRLIGPTELYAVIVARHVWSRFQITLGPCSLSIMPEFSARALKGPRAIPSGAAGFRED